VWQNGERNYYVLLWAKSHDILRLDCLSHLFDELVDNHSSGLNSLKLWFKLLLHSILRLALPNFFLLYFLLICQIFVIILAGRASVVVVIVFVSSPAPAWGSLSCLVRLYIWSQSARSRWCQSGDMAVRIAEALRIELSLELDVGVFRLRTYSIFASNFALENSQIFMHCHRIFSLQVDPRHWTSISLRLRHSQAAHIWDKVTLVLV